MLGWKSLLLSTRPSLLLSVEEKGAMNGEWPVDAFNGHNLRLCRIQAI